jgi:hypothetical protein
MLPDHLQALADPSQLPATIETLNRHETPADAAKAYLDLILHLYWDRKNIAAVIPLAQAGIAYTLQQPDLQKTAKALTYNLASFCWPGWDEPGIPLGEPEIAAGEQAAQQHAQIIETLPATAIEKSRTAWMTGAYHLARRRYPQAIDSFNHAADLAQQAGSETEHLLNRGYALLAQDLAAHTPESQAQFEHLKSQLNALQDGPEFVTQLETAHAAFRP